MTGLPQNTSPLHVFLSHQINDAEFVRQLEFALIELGMSVYRNSTFIGSLLEQIPQEIENCDYFLLVWSKSASQSDWVKKEIDLAFTHEKKQKRDLFIPIILDDSQLPEKISGVEKVYYDFRDQENRDSQFEHLIETLFKSTPGFPEVEQSALVSLHRWLNTTPDFLERRQAYSYIRKINNYPNSVRLLTHYLKSRQGEEYASDRYWIAIYLAEICDEDAKKALESAYGVETNDYARSGLKAALEKCREMLY